MVVNTTPCISAFKMQSFNKFIAAGCTDPGRKRTLNQDCVFIDDAAGIWIVADGMGGHNAGEVASRWVCEHLPKVLATCSSASDAIEIVHRQLQSYAEENAELVGMGTTIILAVQSGADISLYWSGDCRAYQLTKTACTLLTKDHSLVQDLVDLNMIDSTQAKQHPQRNVVTSCLGGALVRPTIDSLTLTLNCDESLLLCSDGLYKELNQSELHSIISAPSSLSATTQNLIEQAKIKGGQDNISSLLIRHTKSILDAT